nr:uncharacterized protein LOC113812865 [Penaeus vannamei]
MYREFYGYIDKLTTPVAIFVRNCSCQTLKCSSRINCERQSQDKILSDRESGFALFSDAGNEISLPDPLISEDPPSLAEVKVAISKQKSDRAAGICGIPVELFKAVGEPMKQMVWSSHSGLHFTLLSIPGKFVTHILLRRITDQLLRYQMPKQSGFTPERRRESGHGLIAGYIYLKEAFDTVHCESLWEILRLRGIPIKIIGIIGPESLPSGSPRGIPIE